MRHSENTAEGNYNCKCLPQSLGLHVNALVLWLGVVA
jgi:hypothetical protein